MTEHKKYMKLCLKLAGVALRNGDAPVGAVIVFEDQIVGEGIEAGKSRNDITCHAEILAIRDAVIKGHAAILNKAILYTTHEPCLMCSYAIRHHKIPQIVYGLAVDHIGGHTSDFQVLSTTKVPKWGEAPKVVGGICQDECKEISNSFNPN
ncbi:nucleoside deaminase [Fulvivirgaceae bacterium BMA10]|uniref:Nucleoside deaminase n=1 Tax=Splendidivirga corallicola TaxID=3051826 RepID=A0ABT8KHR3_9BACT|nr:nucleoside deaminase [Fulvivirgaceae bacterium BMA10]